MRHGASRDVTPDSTGQDSTVQDRTKEPCPLADPPAAEVSPWTRDRKPPHKHDKPDCPPCLVYRLACIAEDALKRPYSPVFPRDAAALKPHTSLGVERIVGQWRAFLTACAVDGFLAKNRTIVFFASRMSADWTVEGRPSAADTQRKQRQENEHEEPSQELPRL